MPQDHPDRTLLTVGDVLYTISEPVLLTAKAGDDLFIALKNTDAGPEEFIIAPVTAADVAAVSASEIALRDVFEGRDLRYGAWWGREIEMYPALVDVPDDLLPKAGATLSGKPVQTLEDTAAPTM